MSRAKRSSNTQGPAADASKRGRKKKLWLWVAGLSIAAIVFAARSRALTRQAYCFDDYEYLVRNHLVLHPSWESARHFVTEVLNPSTVHGYYQPLTMLSLMFDTWLGGAPDHLFVYHFTSLILHALNTAIVFAILYRLFGHALAAGLGALLFGLHPITMEPIPWIGDRKTLLASFFALIAIWAYINYVQARQPISEARGYSPRERGGSRQSFNLMTWYGVCLIAFALSLLSKPTSTMLPVCLLLLDWWPLRPIAARSNGRDQSRSVPPEAEAPSAPASQPFSFRVRHRVVEKAPLFLVAAIAAYITYESQKRTAIVVRPSDYADPLRFPLIFLHNTIFYLHKILLPFHLTPNYGFPDGWSHPNVIAGLIGTPILIAALLLSLRWTRGWVAGWLFFMTIIFPALGFVGFTNVIAADKYTYLPLLGLLLPVTSSLASALSHPSRHVRQMWLAALSLLCVSYAVIGWLYLGNWKDTETLHRYMLSVVPGANVRIGLGLELTKQRRFAEALEQYEAARQEAPYYYGIYFDIGAARLDQGDINGAIAMFHEALERNPRDAATHNSLASILFDQGQLEEAIQHYQIAINEDSYYADARHNLANVFAKRGDTDDAIRWYEQALKINPRLTKAHINLGGQYALKGDFSKAAHHYETALVLEPRQIEVALWLATLYSSPDAGTRKPARAIALAEDAVAQTKRQNPQCLATLAIAYASANTDQAQQHAIQAAREAERLLPADKDRAGLIKQLREDLRKRGVATD